MKKVKVLVPFTDRVTKKAYVKDAEVTMSDERIAEVKAFDVNLIEVIGEVKKPRKKQ